MEPSNNLKRVYHYLKRSWSDSAFNDVPLRTCHSANGESRETWVSLNYRAFQIYLFCVPLFTVSLSPPFCNFSNSDLSFSISAWSFLLSFSRSCLDLTSSSSSCFVDSRKSSFTNKFSFQIVLIDWQVFYQGRLWSCPNPRSPLYRPVNPQLHSNLEPSGKLW